MVEFAFTLNMKVVEICLSLQPYLIHNFWTLLANVMPILLRHSHSAQIGILVVTNQLQCRGAIPTLTLELSSDPKMDEFRNVSNIEIVAPDVTNS